MPSYIFKLTSGAELKADKDFIEGRYTEVRILKTRSGFNNKRLKFVLTAKNGFSSHLTMLEMAKENKLLKGGGRAGYTFEGCDSAFTLKAFDKKYRTDEAFAEAFNTLIEEFLSAQVTERYTDVDETAAAVDLDDEFEE